jgi:hypothetical protein
MAGPPPGATDLEMRAWRQKNDLELRAQEARAKMEELQARRAEAEAKKTRYQEWLAQNDAPPGNDGIEVTDQGIRRTGACARSNHSSGLGPRPVCSASRAQRHTK